MRRSITRSRVATMVTPPGVYAHGAPSPDGRFLAFDRISPPYSYQVPWTAFPHRTYVVDMSGKTVRALADVPLQERATGDDIPSGPRAVAWIASAPATLVWVEARADGRDVANKLDVSSATNEPHALVTLAGRFEVSISSRARRGRWCATTIATAASRARSNST